MRKSRLKILPARCLTSLGFLLLYLACPVIGDMSRARPSSEHNLLLCRLSGPDNPGNGDIRDYAGNSGGTDICQDPVSPTCETSDYELEHCVSVATNNTGAPDINIPEHDSSTNYDQRLEKVSHSRDITVASSYQDQRRSSVRRVSTGVYGVRKSRLVTPVSRSTSNERRKNTREVATVSEPRRTSRRMVRSNSLPTELKTSRLTRAAVQTHAVRRQSPSAADVSRATREVSLTRRRSAEQPSARRIVENSFTRVQGLRREAWDAVSENRRLTRYDARLTERRAPVRTKTTPQDSRNGRRTSASSSTNRRFAGDAPKARIVRMDRVTRTLAASSRRQEVVGSPSRLNYVNTNTDARMTTSSNRRIVREHSISRNIRFREINTPSVNVLARSVFHERSTNRRVSIETVKVPSLSMETFRSMPNIHSVKHFKKRSISEMNNTSSSIWTSQDTYFIKSYSDTDFSTQSVFRGVSTRRKLSPGIMKTRIAVRKPSLLRSSSEVRFDSRIVHISRTNNYRLPVKFPQTRRLVRGRVTPDVSQSRKLSRTTFKNRRMSYSLSEMRRSEHQEFKGRRQSENIPSSRRVSRSFFDSKRMSSDLPTARTLSQATLSSEGNHVATLGARRLSLASSRITSIRRVSFNKRLGGFLATERKRRESSLVGRSTSDMPDFRRIFSDTRRKSSADMSSSERIHLSRYASDRMSVERIQKINLVRGTSSLTSEKVRVSYSRKMSDLSNKLQAEQLDTRRSDLKTFASSPDIQRKFRTTQTTHGIRASFTLPETRRKVSDVSGTRRYSSEGRVSKGRFRATSMNPTLLSALQKTHTSRLEHFFTRRALLAVNPTELSNINVNRRTIKTTSRKIIVDSELFSRQRFAREEMRERRTIATRSSKLGISSSASRRFSIRMTDFRKLSSDESPRRIIFTNNLRTIFKTISRLGERRLTSKLSKARKLTLEVPLFRRISAASEERKRFITNRTDFRKYPIDDSNLRKTSTDILFSRVRTEQQRQRRISLTRRNTAHDLGKRMVASKRSASSSRNVYESRRHFENYSTRRSNTISQQRLHTASSANRRILLNNYVNTFSAKVTIMPSTRNSVVYFFEDDSRHTYDNQALFTQLPCVKRTPTYTHDLNSDTEENSTNSVSMKQILSTTRISVDNLSGMNTTATSFPRKEHGITDLSTHSQQAKVLEDIPAMGAKQRRNDESTIIRTEKKTSWFSHLTTFATGSLLTWFAPLSSKLSCKEFEIYLGKFGYYNTYYYDLFQALKEQISNFNIIQMAKNSLVPDLGDPEQPVLPPDEKTGLELVGGGLFGTALLISARFK